MIVNKSMYPLQTGFSVLSKMQTQMGKLQVQLGTGEKSSTLAGMGRDLPMSLSVRSRLDKIEGYSANIETVNLRLSFLDKTMSRFDKMEGEARNAAVQGQYGTGGINMATLPSLSAARFDEIVTMLNEDVAGRYLFGGNVTDRAPLPDTETLLNGAAGKDGFLAVSSRRATADGVNDEVTATDLPGRLQWAPATPAGQVNLVEDGGTAHPFGFKFSTASTTSANVTVEVQPRGAPTPETPGSLSIGFAATPKPGDSISIGLTLPDGTETQVKLTATAESPAPAGSFTIGQTAEESAASFKEALGKSLTLSAKTELRAASTFAAATDFFDPAGKPQIPNSGTKPTELVNGSASVVQWYRGGITPDGDNPRASVSAAVDDASRVNYGMQANESGFLRLIRSQAALAVSQYNSETTVRSGFEDQRLAAMSEPEGAARDVALANYEAEVAAAYRLETGFFDGMAKRQQAELSEAHNTESGSIEVITMEIGVALNTLQNATKRHTDYKAQLTNILSDVETVSTEDIAMQILALQTRLQASYQTTAMVSQLSLVKFL